MHCCYNAWKKQEKQNKDDTQTLQEWANQHQCIPKKKEPTGKLSQKAQQSTRDYFSG